jgi:TRAF3-interacting protein 1
MTVRPTTARAAPPRVIPRRQEADEAAAALATQEEHIRVTLGRPAVKVITESDKGTGDTEDDTLFVVENALDRPPDHNNEEDRLTREHTSQPLSSADHHDLKGSLLKQLQETKEHLEGSAITISAMERPSSSSNSTDFFKTHEVEKLRQSLQSLSRFANPLGRIVDALQEDTDSMLTELKMWEEEYRDNKIKLEQEKSSNDLSLEELKKRLRDLESEVEEENDKLGMFKASIERQEDKLRRVIALVVQKEVQKNTYSSTSSTKSGVRTFHR